MSCNDERRRNGAMNDFIRGSIPQPADDPPVDDRREPKAPRSIDAGAGTSGTTARRQPSPNDTIRQLIDRQRE